MRFIAKDLHIENFRKLKNLDIELGEKITVFSGINGVGKSNILSLIAMAFGTSGTRIAGGRFYPHFDEYFVITEEEFKNQNNDKYRAFLKIDAEKGFIQKRLGLRNDFVQGRGVRILPRVTSHFSPEKTVEDVKKEAIAEYGIGDSARVPVPTIFISLSRLFPMGETELDKKGISTNNEIIRDGIIDKYIEWYNKVLPNSISKNEFKTSRIKKVVNSNGRIHVELLDSDARTQSVGEDNLGTIISALLDFYYLKEKQGNKYNGGIICIDELDSALHPSAQMRLFDLLDEMSIELSLQVFMTTHSITLLERIINKQNRDSEAYKLVYILDPRFPRIKKNINSIEDIKSDMFEENSYYQPILKVYCEDKETEFIFEQLSKIMKQDDNFSLPEYQIFPMHLGHRQLEDLRNFDKYFESVVMLVDGDAKCDKENNLDKYLNHDIKGLNSRKLEINILSLPTFLAPESYLYFILTQIENDREFWRQLERLNLKKDYTAHNLETIINKVSLNDEQFISNNDLKKVFCGNLLETIKEFVSETQVLSYYYDENPEDLCEFKNKTREIFKIVDKKVKSNLQ